MKKYDVVIVGAGTAGLSARSEVEKVTQNYLVVDDGPLGTTCARVGCMPSKVLIQVANDFHRRQSLEQEGILGGENLSVDDKTVLSHVRSLRDRFVRGVFGGMESWQETHLVRKRASFVTRNILDIGGEQIEAKKIILATGSKPLYPEPWKKYEKYFLTTDEFFEMEEFPESVGVIGLGVIGLELGQAMARLGVDLMAFTRNQRIGGLSDPDIQSYALQSFSKEFDIIVGDSDIAGEKDGKILVRSEGKEYAFDKVLLAMGRRPNFKGLNLEAIDVQLSKSGVPEFDRATLQIKGTDIFIAGDNLEERALLHEAADEGRIAGYNSVREKLTDFSRREFMAVTFSDPDIAVVGQTYEELKDSGVEFETGEITYEGQGRAIVMLKEKGLVHLYGEKATGRLLGAEMFAPKCEHFAHLLAWSINQKMTVHQILSMPFYHPVLEEGLRTAFRSLAKKLPQAPPDLEVPLAK